MKADYHPERFQTVAREIPPTTLKRIALKELLERVAIAVHDIEWVENGQKQPGDEDQPIDDVFDMPCNSCQKRMQNDIIAENIKHWVAYHHPELRAAAEVIAKLLITQDYNEQYLLATWKLAVELATTREARREQKG